MTLMVATPVRAAELETAQVSLGYAQFREQLARHVPSYQGIMVFSLDVVRARNRVVGLMFSKSEFAEISHLLFVDDDNWCEDIRIVPEMIEACKGVLGAPYTNKREPMRWVHRPDGAGGVAGVGFGFTMVTRECLEALAKEAHWYVDLPQGLRCPNLFGQLYEQVGGMEILLSEDFSFCKRAREAGFPVELYEQAGIINHAGGHVWNARQMKGGVVG